MDAGFELITGRLIAEATPRLASLSLLTLRVAIVAFVAPWPGRLVPGSIRAFLALTTAMMLTTTLADDQLVAMEPSILALSALGEIAYASALGFSLWVAIGALSTLGQVAGLQLGFGLRGAFDPSTGSEMNAVAQIAALAWMPIALEMGVHHHLLRALSFPPAAVCAGELLARAELIAEASLAGGARMFVVALVGAGPVFALSMLSHAGLGAISRAVPQAMILGEALGAAAVLGMIAVGASALAWPHFTAQSLNPILEAFTAR